MTKYIGTIVETGKNYGKKILGKTPKKMSESISIMDGLVPKANYKGLILKLTSEDEKVISDLSDEIGSIAINMQKHLDMSRSRNLPKSTRKYYENLAYDENLKIQELEEKIRGVKINRINIQRANAANNPIEDTPVISMKRNGQAKVAELEILPHSRLERCVPARNYDGPLLKLTIEEAREIDRLQNELTNLNIDVINLEGMCLNTKISKSRRNVFSKQLENKKAKIEDLQQQIREIKIHRFAIQKGAVSGSFVDEFY